MKKIIASAIAALVLGAASVSANPFVIVLPGSSTFAAGELSGGVSSFAATSGASYGDGSMSATASQFSGSEGTMNFDGQFGGAGDETHGFTVTMSAESFASGFGETATSGNGWANSNFSGEASGDGSWGIVGLTDW